MIHRTSQHVSRRDGYRMLDERHMAESPSSESSTPSGIPNETLWDSDGGMLHKLSLRTPSHVADSDNSHSAGVNAAEALS